MGGPGSGRKPEGGSKEDDKSFTRDQIKDMSVSDYEKNRDDIHNALQKGNIIKDNGPTSFKPVSTNDKRATYKIKNMNIVVDNELTKNPQVNRAMKHMVSLPKKLVENKPSISFKAGLRGSTVRGFEVAGIAVKGSITLYPENGKVASNETITHEITHTFDTSRHVYSNSKEYEQAVKNDKVETGIGFTSDYAKRSYYMPELKNFKYGEDFAEGVSFYITDRVKFATKHPNRASYYKKILGE